MIFLRTEIKYRDVSEGNVGRNFCETKRVDTIVNGTKCHDTILVTANYEVASSSFFSVERIMRLPFLFFCFLFFCSANYEVAYFCLFLFFVCSCC